MPAAAACCVVRLRLGELRQVVPDSLAFYFEHVARGTLCEGAALEHEVVDRDARLRALRRRAARVVRRQSPRSDPAWRGVVPLPGVRGGGRRRSSRGTSSRSSRSRSRSQHAPGEGSCRRGRARRQQHDRARESRRLRPPRRGGRQPHERARRGQDEPARARARAAARRRHPRRRARRRRPGLLRRDPHRLAARPGHADQHATRASAASATSTPTWCARRCRRCRSPRSTCS